MKVLQVATHMNIGGIANYIYTLSRALKRCGVETVVASSGGSLEDELRRQHIPHRYLDIMTKSEISPKVVKSIFSLRRIVREEKIDIIHAHTRVSQTAAFFTSRLARIPYVTTCHGFFKKRLRKIFDTWGYRVVAISDAVKEHLSRDLGVREERIELLYSGVDADRFTKDYSGDEAQTVKRSIGLRCGPVVGTIGRLSSVKGQRFLIEAMARVIRERKDVQCLVIGDGKEKETLEGLAKSMGISDSVRFISSVVDTERYLAIMDVFVFPSIKEGLGIALLEALASGRACVASRIGGIEDIIKHNFNGILVDVGDSEAIADSVKMLLDDAGLRGRMGERGRSLVREAFTIDSMADKMVKLYEGALER